MAAYILPPKSKHGLPRIFDMTRQQCLWSKIGALGPRLCSNAFDCLSCPIDQLMQRRKTPPENCWTRERWLNTPPAERYCRHMLSGRVGNKLCHNGYNCAACAYDQMLRDRLLTNPDGDLDLAITAGFLFAKNYYYSSGHLWARVEYGGLVRIGLDEFAARLFGPDQGFVLPSIGSTVGLGAICSSFTRQEHRAELASPLSGVVVARNPKVMEPGGEVVQDPYGQGWLLLLEPFRLHQDLKALVSETDIPPWLDREYQRLSDYLTAETGQRLAATGSRVLPDIFGSMPGLDWDRLVTEFLGGGST